VPLTDREQRVCTEIERRRDELAQLACDLIEFDTTARLPGDPPREEAPLQVYLAGRLGAAGAHTELWEPRLADVVGRPLVPPGLDFQDRPQLAARFAGAGGGPTLLLNGHIDVVSAEPLERWQSHPFRPEVRDGLLYGRGACDMKGGIAAMVFAAEVLADLDVELRGDLLLVTNTDEESSGAGGSAVVAHGITADAAIVTEATGFDVWVACRGSEYCRIVVPGRPGHAEVFQPDWREGGAVNAIEKAALVIEAIRGLREEWAARPGLDHPYLSRPDMLPTLVRAGEWAVTYPAECELTCAVLYLPGQADPSGWGASVRAEVEEWIRRETAADDWLAEHPPSIHWEPNAVMPLEVAEDEPIVGVVRGAGADVGRPGKLSGLDSWYDGATFAVLAGIPTVAFGPAGFDQRGVSVAHTIDEHVPVDDLVHCAQGLAVTAMRFCQEV
jgi:acetylornithine deacetylase